MNNFIELNPNQLVEFLGKQPDEFTKEDIISFIVQNGIKMVNFRYVGEDGRLKTLNFVINSRDYLESILTFGERVDGSSLFSFIEAGSSDLYVVPRFNTAFINPFAETPSIDILCSFYTKDGRPLESAPDEILRKACQALEVSTGYSFHVMGELEYYIISKDNDLYNPDDQKGYHESAPFTKWEEFRKKAMLYIAKAGGEIKYGHSEVGNFRQEGCLFEQNEIEFLPTPATHAVDQLLIAKWILRNLAFQYGVEITFSPKITAGKAGSGLHIHTRLMDGKKNAYVTDGKLNENALKAIAGMLSLSSSLTAFGNTNPTSYFRLVPHQEAPTNICWGDRNRSVLVRVPLGWGEGVRNMLVDANPLEHGCEGDMNLKQTVEFRCPDGSADLYLLVAGLATAVRYGFEMEDGVAYAKQRYVDVNIFDDKYKDVLERLSQLPVSCSQSADELECMRAIYEAKGVFSPRTIDGVIRRLKSFKDEHLRDELANEPDKMEELVKKFINCG